MIDFTIFTGGENRLYVPPPLYLFIECLNVITLTCLICTKKIQDSTKQVLSVPLLTLLIVFPCTFSMNNNFASFSVATVNFNMFLRFIELYWVGPIVQRKPVHTTLHQLSIDLWTFVRRFPIKETQKGSRKGLVHVVFKLCWFSILSDVLINWATSFTGHEVMVMVKERPVMYFIYCFTFGTILYSCFKSLSYMIQLVYTLVFDKGYYKPELWRDVPKNPLVAKNLTDLWSNRWHQTFKSTWLSFPFKPVYILTNQYLSRYIKNPKPFGYLIASLSVFFISGLMHEYVVAVNVGWYTYRHLKGEQTLFFMSQGLGVTLEFLIEACIAPKLSNQFKQSVFCDLVQRVWGIFFIYYSFYYILHGFILFDFHLHHPFRLSRPYLQQLPVQSYFGSQLNGCQDFSCS